MPRHEGALQQSGNPFINGETFFVKTSEWNEKSYLIFSYFFKWKNFILIQIKWIQIFVLFLFPFPTVTIFFFLFHLNPSKHFSFQIISWGKKSGKSTQIFPFCSKLFLQESCPILQLEGRKYTVGRIFFLTSSLLTYIHTIPYIPRNIKLK